MKVYFIPGLGFDQRIFKKLDLGDCEPIPLDWVAPNTRESFGQYAQRFAEKIDDSDKKTVLIGHSLGGMLSQEIARFKSIDIIFLLSSIRSRAEMPFFFKSLAPLGLYHLFTKGLTFSTFRFWAKQHDYETQEEQELFKDMVRQQSNAYLKWALKELSIWQTPTVPATTSIFQIHGKKDSLFPISKLKKPDQVIPKAGHFMVYKHPQVISQSIKDRLSN